MTQTQQSIDPENRAQIMLNLADRDFDQDLRLAKIAAYKAHISALFDLISDDASLKLVGLSVAKRIEELEKLLIS